MMKLIASRKVRMGRGDRVWIDSLRGKKGFKQRQNETEEEGRPSAYVWKGQTRAEAKREEKAKK